MVSISRRPDSGGSNQFLPGPASRAVVPVLFSGSSGLDMIISPPNDSSLCRLPAARFFRRHIIHSISPNPSAADATPTTTPASCGLVRTCFLLAAAAVDDVAAGVVVDGKVCNTEVGVGKIAVVGSRYILFELVGESIEVALLNVAVTILVFEVETIVDLGMLAERDEIEMVCSSDTVCMVAVRVPWVSGCAFSTPVQY